ncbi:MAG: hypothetical protein ACW96M_03445 [Candidatus Thorarchaeota archaeon]
MEYTEEFLNNRDVAIKLVADVGYSTNQTLSAVAGLGELCTLALVLKQAVTGHERGTLLPHRFEVSLTVKPFRLQRTHEVNPLEALETHNVLISLGNEKYRAMLSSMLNRVFMLTAQNGPESIRSNLSGLGNTVPLESALDKIESEIVQTVHDSVDVNYLEIDTLDTQMTPQILLNTLRSSKEFAAKLVEVGVNIDGPNEDSSLSLDQISLDSAEFKLIADYFRSVIFLASLVDIEVKRQKELISKFSIYPRSFVGRKTTPLIGSSWNHRSDFRSHPIISKFLKLIEDNHERLAKLADLYEDYVRELVETVEHLPRGIDAVSMLKTPMEGLPNSGELRVAWDLIQHKSAALWGQAKFIEAYVASIDTLFEREEN